MKSQFIFEPDDGQVGDAEAFLTLGVAAAVAICFALAAILDFSAGREPIAAAPAAKPPAVVTVPAGLSVNPEPSRNL